MILLKTIRINKSVTSRIPGIHNARRSMASAWYRGGNSQRDNKVSLGLTMARTKMLDFAMCLTVHLLSFNSTIAFQILHIRYPSPAEIIRLSLKCCPNRML